MTALLRRSLSVALLSFQPEFLVLLQKGDRFFQSPRARLLLLRVHDPRDVEPAIGRREVLEMLPGPLVCHQSLPYESRECEFAFAWLRLRFVAKGHNVDLRQPSLGHSSFSYEFAHPSLVH